MQVIVMGDKTSHGGVVISASSSMLANGKKVSLVGDLVSCPVPGHGVNKIAQGSSILNNNGKSVAVHGCLCECGCQSIATQSGFFSIRRYFNYLINLNFIVLKLVMED